MESVVPALTLEGLGHLEHELSDTAFLTRWGIGLLPVLERGAEVSSNGAEQHRLKTAVRLIRSVYPTT